MVWPFLLTAHFIDPAFTALAATLVVTGHCFPIWLKFKGGKGVATSLAAIAALDIRLGGLIRWCVVNNSPSFTLFVAVSPISIARMCWSRLRSVDDTMSQMAILFLGALVWSRHHANIGRLLTGTETKIGDQKHIKSDYLAYSELFSN